MKALAILAILCGVARAEPVGAIVDRVMKPWARADGPGCAVGVIQHGALVYAHGYGMADLERKVPITADTVFDIASAGKQFTGLAIHLLAADGKLALDDDIRTHVPELPALAPITLRMLLHHTSGIRDYTNLLALAGHDDTDVTSHAQGLEMVTRQRALVFAPGTEFAYSNSNYLLLAETAARASKTPFPKLLVDRIFRPLGMAHTYVHADHAALVPNRALGYARDDAKSPWKLAVTNWDDLGDGNVLTTVGDLARWDANFDRSVVGKGAALASFLATAPLAGGKPNTYASGLYIDTWRGQPWLGHDGAWVGFRAYYVRYPKLATSLVALCNAAEADPEAITTDIVGALFPKELAPPPEPPAPPSPPVAKLAAAQRAAWSGTYRTPAHRMFVVAAGPGDALTRQYDDDDAGALLPIDAHAARTESGARYAIAGAAPHRTITFHPDDGTADQTFIEVVPHAPASLAPYAGRFYAPELDVVWTFRVEAGALVAHATGSDAKVRWISADEFDIPAWSITLRVAPKRDAMTLDSGRIVGIALARF